jgi:hypothetical protein
MKRDISRNDPGLGDPEQLTHLNFRLTWKLRRAVRDCSELARIPIEQLAQDAMMFYFNDIDETLIARRELALTARRKLREDEAKNGLKPGSQRTNRGRA